MRFYYERKLLETWILVSEIYTPGENSESKVFVIHGQNKGWTSREVSRKASNDLKLTVLLLDQRVLVPATKATSALFTTCSFYNLALSFT